MEDFDISNYSFTDLKDILGIENEDEKVSRQDIVSAVNHFMASYEMNSQMTRFLKEAQQKMIDVLTMVDNGKVDKEFEFHKEDRGNPKLGNSLTKLIVIDSQYCLDTHPHSVKSVDHLNKSLDTKTMTQPLTTKFTCHFSEPIVNVLSFSLYSYTIPYTYYNIDSALNNNFFIISVNDSDVKFTIPDGNYGCDFLLSTVNELLVNGGFSSPTNTFLTVVKQTGKLNFNFSTTTFYDDNNNTLLNDMNTQIIFFSTTETTKSRVDVFASSLIPLCVNQTLGWMMGFRQTNYPLDTQGMVQAECVLNINASKYFVLNIDDYCNSHLKTNLIGVETNPTRTTLPLPTFLRNAESRLAFSDTTSKNPLQPKTKRFHKDTFPRNLTTNQLYALNEIIKNQGVKENYMRTNFLTQHAFAVIPLKNPKHHFGEVYVEFGGSVQDNKRVFNGPITLNKLTISLVNDRGICVNLNGAEWSFVIKLEILIDTESNNNNSNNDD